MGLTKFQLLCPIRKKFPQDLPIGFINPLWALQSQAAVTETEAEDIL